MPPLPAPPPPITATSLAMGEEARSIETVRTEIERLRKLILKLEKQNRKSAKRIKLLSEIYAYEVKSGRYRTAT